jgi:hypothetical protein
MIPSASSSRVVPSLQENCASAILSNNLDNNYADGEQELICRNTLAELWGDLKLNVPEGALGLHRQISRIEKEYQKEHPSSNDQFPPNMNAADLFRRLSQAFSAEFAEAAKQTNGRFVLGNKIPVTCIAYANLQRILEQKWEGDALRAMWSDPRCSLARNLIVAIAGGGGQPIQSLTGLRTWLNNPVNAVHLNQITTIRSKAEVKVCPREIGKFQALENLMLRETGLRKFSCDLTACTLLQWLDLNDNALQNFSCDLTHCTQLEGLDLSGNQIKDFSCDLTHCTELMQLNLKGNQLESFSCDLTHCTQLHELNLSGNQIKDFSCDLTHCTELMQLNLKGNQLESFSCDLTHCTQLRELNLSGNLLKGGVSSDLLPLGVTVIFNESD